MKKEHYTVDQDEDSVNTIGEDSIQTHSEAKKWTSQYITNFRTYLKVGVVLFFLGSILFASYDYQTYDRTKCVVIDDVQTCEDIQTNNTGELVLYGIMIGSSLTLLIIYYTTIDYLRDMEDYIDS